MNLDCFLLTYTEYMNLSGHIFFVSDVNSYRKIEGLQLLKTAIAEAGYTRKVIYFSSVILGRLRRG